MNHRFTEATYRPSSKLASGSGRFIWAVAGRYDEIIVATARDFPVAHLSGNYGYEVSTEIFLLRVSLVVTPCSADVVYSCTGTSYTSGFSTGDGITGTVTFAAVGDAAATVYSPRSDPLGGPPTFTLSSPTATCPDFLFVDVR